MKGETEDSFIAKRGNYAVLSPKRQYLQMKPGG
jgi:hypothetical protein